MLRCPRCFYGSLSPTGFCDRCQNQSTDNELEGAKKTALEEEVAFSRNLEWDQNVEGCSLDCLDKAIELVTRHGFRIRTLMASSARGRALIEVIRLADLWKNKDGKDLPVFPGTEVVYKGIPGTWFTTWGLISDFEIYVIGDIYPPTKESVAVWTFRRPVTGGA